MAILPPNHWQYLSRLIYLARYRTLRGPAIGGQVTMLPRILSLGHKLGTDDHIGVMPTGGEGRCVSQLLTLIY